jgi:hypothetical protein
MDSIFANGPKVCALKPRRGDGFLRVIKIHSMPSFGGKAKPSAPFSKTLQHVKITVKREQRRFKGKIHHFLCQVPTILLLDGSSDRIARVLWWMNQEFSPVNIIPPFLHAHISHRGCSLSVVHRRSLIPST